MEQQDYGTSGLLQDIVASQQHFNTNFISQTPSEDEAIRWTKEVVLGLHSELDEVLDELSWKPHRNEHKPPINRDNLLIECVDVLKYALSLFTTWGFTADDIWRAYWDKTAVVEQRYLQELACSSDKPVVGVDIDNVLCDYLLPFMRVFDPMFSKDMCYSISPQVLSGLSIEEYSEAKHIWRNSGIKAELPVIEGAVEMTQRLRAAGHLVVLISSRPVHRYKRIFSDTIAWLNGNGKGIEWDGILFADDKWELLKRTFGDRLVAAVDDNPDQALQLASSGIKVFVPLWKYNEHLKGSDNIVCVDNLGEVIL